MRESCGICEGGPTSSVGVRRRVELVCHAWERTTAAVTLTTSSVDMSDSAQKRRRIQRSPSPPVYKLDDEDDTYEPYIPVTQRREAALAKLSALSSTADAREKAKKQLEELLEKEDAEREEEKRREKARKERTLLLEAQEVHSRKAAEGARLCIHRSSRLTSSTFRCKEDRRRKG